MSKTGGIESGFCDNKWGEYLSQQLWVGSSTFSSSSELVLEEDELSEFVSIYGYADWFLLMKFLLLFY